MRDVDGNRKNDCERGASLIRHNAGRISRRLFLANTLVVASSALSGNLGALAKEHAGSLPTKAGIDELKKRIKGQVLTRDDVDFKSVVFDGLWNRLHADRTPQIVAKVANDQDVCEAVKYARSSGLKVVVRGGGHNWCCPSLRNGGMMIDLTDLNRVISIDAEKRKAVVQPIISNRDIQRYLNAHGMSYPSGHCPPVKLSGYLLSGGMAWNQGVWGPGVGSIEAIDIVTADGELIRASKEHNYDYFWAARGAGPGFFGVATQYHLKLYPLPKYITASSYSYSLAHVGTIAEWLGKTASKLPAKVELSLFMLTAPPELADKCKDFGGKVAMVTATVFADSEEEAKNAITLLDGCPVIGQCLSKSVNEHVVFERLFDMSGALWPADRRNHVEAMFSNSNPKDLYLAVRDHFTHSPSPETLIMFAFFTGPNVPAPLLEDAAFSMSAHLYGGPWTMWKNASDDQVNSQWHKKCLELLKPFVHGHYVSESDTVSYPEHIKASYTAANFKRIEELRKKYDPRGVFFNYSDGLT